MDNKKYAPAPLMIQQGLQSPNLDNEVFLNRARTMRNIYSTWPNVYHGSGQPKPLIPYDIPAGEYVSPWWEEYYSPENPNDRFWMFIPPRPDLLREEMREDIAIGCTKITGWDPAVVRRYLGLHPMKDSC